MGVSLNRAGAWISNFISGAAVEFGKFANNTGKKLMKRGMD